MIRFVPEVASTNEELANRLSGGGYLPEGEWLVADRQTAGRGRSGRNWADGAGNFMGSTVVHTRFGDPAAPTLALVAGLAVQSVVVDCLPAGASALLKWPNDVLVGGAKLAGILLEKAGEAVIIGIGVNLAATPEVSGRETVSLADLGVAPGRDDFAGQLAGRFDIELQRWREFGLSPILRRWEAAAHPQGTPLAVDAPGGRLTGSFAGLAEDGALLLRLADGGMRAIHAGEVSLAPGEGG